MLQDQSASGITMSVPTLVALDDGHTIPIDQPVLLIGRSKRRAHLRINDPYVSSVHCEIHAEDGSLHVRDCSRHGTRINGRLIEEAELLEGDILQIVKHRYRVESGFGGGTGPEQWDESRRSDFDPDQERFSVDAAPTRRRHSKPVVRDNWFIRMAGVELGPMPWSDLVEMAHNKEMTDGDEVRQEKQADWKLAGGVRGLFSYDDDASADMAMPESETATWETPAGNLGGLTDSPPIANPEPDSDFVLQAYTPGPDAPQARPVAPEPERKQERVRPAASVTPAAPVTNDDSGVSLPQEEGDSSISLPVQAGILDNGRESVADAIDLDVKIEPGSPAPKREAPVSHADEPAKPVRERKHKPVEPRKLDYEPDPENPRYFLRRKGREFGPLEFQKLQQLAEKGRLSQLDAIRTDINTDWVSASMVDGLFDEDNSRDLSDEGYAASLLAEMDSESADKAPADRPDVPVPTTVVASTESPAEVPAPASFSAPPSGLSALPPLPVPRAKDDTPRKVAVDVLAPLIYLQAMFQTWPRIAAGGVVGVFVLYMLIPSYGGSYVYGVVTLDGQPLTDASITLSNQKLGIEVSGLVNEDGSFVVTTMEGGMKPGTYGASFMPREAEPPEVVAELQRMYRAQQGIGGALAQYQELDAADPTGSGSRQKPAGQLPPGTIPFKYRTAFSSGLTVEVIDGKNEFNIDLDSSK